MKIRNKALLDQFVKKHADSKSAMQKFVDIVEETDWHSLRDIKEIYNSADYVSNGRYVFDIKGNKYRIVSVIIFIEGVLTIRFVGTHAEYDKIDACSI